jgi:hypothetical protein
VGSPNADEQLKKMMDAADEARQADRFDPYYK